jgi:hypothetical protein
VRVIEVADASPSAPPPPDWRAAGAAPHALDDVIALPLRGGPPARVALLPRRQARPQQARIIAKCCSA